MFELTLIQSYKGSDKLLQGKCSMCTYMSVKVVGYMLLSMLTAFVFSGQASHASEPGFFRICYAIVDCETILQLVQRLVGFITKSDAERQQVPLWINTASMQKAKQEIEADSTQPAKPAFE